MKSETKIFETPHDGDMNAYLKPFATAPNDVVGILDAMRVFVVVVVVVIDTTLKTNPVSKP